jgi:sulfatase maturation enzyme AslB (radical SAM superfamily)
MKTDATIRSADFVLTSACNLRCAYCYQDARTGRSMPWEILGTAIDRVLSYGSRRVELRFYGGEPLLELDLVRRGIEHAKARRAPDQEVRGRLVTNGVLLGDDVAAFLDEHAIEIALSFDGVPAAQRLRGEETFPVLDRLLDRLRSRFGETFEKRLSVCITVAPAALPFLAESVEYFIKKGVKRIQTDPVVLSEDWPMEGIEELERQFAHVFESSLCHYRATGEIPFVLFRKGPQGGFRGSGPSVRSRPMCGVGRGGHIAVDVDGQVHGCVLFAESFRSPAPPFLQDRLRLLAMGDIRDDRFAERYRRFASLADSDEILSRQEEKRSSFGECRSCEHFERCAVCPLSIGRLPGNRDPRRIPDWSCAFQMVALRHRKRFPALRSRARRTLSPS